VHGTSDVRRCFEFVLAERFVEAIVLVAVLASAADAVDEELLDELETGDQRDNERTDATTSHD
jgi:hypothetical protein